MHHFRARFPKWGLTPPKEISSHVFKMAFFPKFFEDFIKYIRQITGKKIKLFLELFINKIFEKTFVIFVSKQSLDTSSVPGLVWNCPSISVSMGLLYLNILGQNLKYFDVISCRSNLLKPQISESKDEPRLAHTWIGKAHVTLENCPNQMPTHLG